MDEISRLEKELDGIEQKARETCSSLSKLTNEHVQMLDGFFEGLGLAGMINPVVSVQACSPYMPRISYSRLQGCYPASEEARLAVAAAVTPDQDEMINAVLDRYATMLSKYERDIRLLEVLHQESRRKLGIQFEIAQDIIDYVDAA